MPVPVLGRLTAAATAAALLAATALTPAAGASEVVVRPGQTLSGIAAAHGVSVGALAAANGLTDANLVVAGTALSLPGTGGATGAGGRYRVAAGDTVWSIAAAHGVGAGALVAANGLADPDLVVTGTWLAIPAGGGASPAPATAVPAPGPAPATAAPAGGEIQAVYTVQAGDTLSGIAERFGVSVAAVAGENGIGDGGLVVIGRSLRIPAAAGLPARLVGDPARLALMPTFDHWAAAYGVPADLLKSVTWLESGWQVWVESSVGAMGIGQLLPSTVDFVEALVGEDLNPWDAGDNIRMSARFLRWLLDQTGGDSSAALAGYYQGLQSVRDRGPYGETLAYVAAVQELRDRFD